MNHSFIESFKEAILFAKRIKNNPRQIGAIAPSSMYLAKVMAQAAIKDAGDGYFLEIGAGTGRFTKALINAGMPEEKIICIEIDTDLCSYLKEKFPKVNIIQGNACYLSDIIDKTYTIESIISGIPMMNLHLLTRKAIIENAFKVLKPGGKFIQFTYNLLSSSIEDKEFKLEKKRIAFVLRNLPPVSVWSYNRSKEE